MTYRLGIDLGGTNIAVGVVDENYTIVGRAKVKTALPRPAEEICDSMAQAARMAIKDANLTLTDIVSAGLGTPGNADSETGVVRFSNNLQFFNTPLADMMKQRLGIDFLIENDANAAAYGEYIAGAGKGTKDFVAITLGTGVGGGVIVNGSMLSGCMNFGGELGHTVIKSEGVQCTCGRKGCFEAYASATALVRQTKEAMQNNKDSLMWKLCAGLLDNVNGTTAWDGWRQGDAAATQVVENYCQYVAEGCTNLINIFQPEKLCIGGGISAEKDNLLKPVNAFIAENAYSRRTIKSDRAFVAALGNDAGIIGAAFLDKLHK